MPKPRRRSGFKSNGGGVGDRARTEGRTSRSEAAEARCAEREDQFDRPRQPDHAHRDGFKQAFNGQAVVTSDQVIVAVDVAPENTDFDAFHPMLDAARANLDAAGVTDPMRAVVADAGYSNKPNRTQDRPAGSNPILLMAVPRLGGKKPAEGQVRKIWPGRGNDPSRARMIKRLASPAGSRLYARRKTMVEPVFGQIKQLGGPRMRHRGRDKVNTEWTMMAAAHNLLKCWRHRSWEPAC
jgi:hypothetical protein